MLTAHEYKGGPAASSVERERISFSIQLTSLLFFFFFHPLATIFLVWGKTLSIIVRSGEDKTAPVAD